MTVRKHLSSQCDPKRKRESETEQFSGDPEQAIQTNGATIRHCIQQGRKVRGLMFTVVL